MPWCPKCKAEDGEEWKHLVFLYNEMEADIVMGLLETAGIPVIKTYKGMGVLHKVYTGKATGVDLFVPAERLAQAKELLEAETKD